MATSDAPSSRNCGRTACRASSSIMQYGHQWPRKKLITSGPRARRSAELMICPSWFGKAKAGARAPTPSARSASVLSLKKAEHMARLARLLYREGEHAHRTPEGSAGVDRGRARHAGIADDSGADPAAPGAARADHLAVQRGAGQYRGRTETAHAGADDREVAGSLRARPPRRPLR